MFSGNPRVVLDFNGIGFQTDLNSPRSLGIDKNGEFFFIFFGLCLFLGISQVHTVRAPINYFEISIHLKIYLKSQFI